MQKNSRNKINILEAFTRRAFLIVFFFCFLSLILFFAFKNAPKNNVEAWQYSDTPLFDKIIEYPSMLDNYTKVKLGGIYEIYVDSNYIYSSSYYANGVLNLVAFIKMDFDGNLINYIERGTEEGKIAGNSYSFALGTDNCFYIVDYTGRKIVKYDKSLNYIKQWGSSGSSDGQFNNPFDAEADSNNIIYVTDMGNHRIQAFDSEGNFLGKVGSLGTGNLNFNTPRKIAIDSDNYLYITDGGNNRIQKFIFDKDTGEFTFIRSWGGTGSADGLLNAPRGITIAPDNTVWVADRGNNRIQVFSRDGEYIKKYTEYSPGKNLNQPYSFSFGPDDKIYLFQEGIPFGSGILKLSEDFLYEHFYGKYYYDYGSYNSISEDINGNIYIASSINNKILQYNNLEQYITNWGEYGNLDGQINSPCALGISPDQYIYVASCASGYSNIQKFTLNGTFVKKLGGNGSGQGQFSFSCNNTNVQIVFDTYGNLYVNDICNRRVQKFNKNGDFLKSWGGAGSADGQFGAYSPAGIAIDSKNNIYTSDRGNYRVQKFDSEGNFLLKWGSSGKNDGQFSYNEGIAVGANDTIYVANGQIWDSYNEGAFIGIHIFTDQGVFLNKFGGIGIEPEQTGYPRKLFINSNSDIYVLDLKSGILSFTEIKKYVFDKQPPTIDLSQTIKSSNEKTFDGGLSDLLTNITSIQYKFGEGEWTSCQPKDGILDSKEEQFVCDLSSDIQTDGEFNVSIRGVDNKTNESTESFEFIYDKTAPVLSTILEDYSSKKDILVSLIGIDNLTGVSEMVVCENSDFTGCEWESYATTKSLTLSSGDATKTIYAKVKDKAGNISETEQDTIILDTVNNKPVITQLGLIKNITDKDSLYYHFNANRVKIYGTAESNSTVQFERSNGTKHTTQTDAEGKFFILIDLPNGESKLTYSSTDLAGNVSGSRIITLNIDPYYVTSTEETTQETVAPDEEEVAEEITTPTEQEDEAVKPGVKSLLVVDSSGNILTNKTIEVEGKKYTTDEKGYIHTDTQFSEEMIASIEGRKYTIDPANTYLTLTEADEGNKNFNYLYLIIPILLLVIMTIYFLKKQNKN